MSCENPRDYRGLSLPCGSCRYCLKLKRWYYSARIVAECSVAEKNWFVTLTLRRRMYDQIGYRLVQRFLKRVRKKVSVRYACVAEHGGKSTRRLHYHLVLHGGVYLTQRTIRRSWKGGISQAVLVGRCDAKNVGLYSSKLANYTAKGSRFRFSQRYGTWVLHKWMDNPIVQEVLRNEPKAVIRISGYRMPRRLYRELLPVPEFRSLYQDEDTAGSVLISQHGQWL